MKRALILLLFAASVIGSSQVLISNQKKNLDRIYQLSELKTAVLTAGKHKIRAWIMDTPSKRQEGMMFLHDNEVKIEQGMLFVFPSPEPLSFWMKNTLIPLDIAYIDKAGRVLNTPTMKALDETGVPSKGEAMYALEMKQGAFKKFGIKPGMKIGIPAGIKAKT